TEPKSGSIPLVVIVLLPILGLLIIAGLVLFFYWKKRRAAAAASAQPTPTHNPPTSSQLPQDTAKVCTDIQVPKLTEDLLEAVKTHVKPEQIKATVHCAWNSKNINPSEKSQFIRRSAPNARMHP
ncbi:hypothetical protein PENTCL1PPCAC_24285, partial [Pristionchus entomophagus]